MGRLIPDLLSLSRLALAYPFFRAMQLDGSSAAWVAAACFVAAVVTDLLDGRLARRLGTVSARGRALDHTSDFVFVASGLFGAAIRGALPVWLPLLVSLAFLQYVLDSLVLHRSRELRLSRLGRWNGVLYFVPAAGDILVRLGFALLAPAVPLVAWALVFTTLLSMGERARSGWLSRRRAPGSHEEGRGARSRH